ncbi:hypothetical protein [Flavobacterium ginsenosidimutans]|uniref:HNH domain-containing protein n=1 Tax=Flavobacterium ginsenosidimutans TaxID=687844 RepID=A0ABZ2Q5I0_9FLAO
MLTLKPTIEALDFHRQKVDEIFTNVIKKEYIKREGKQLKINKSFISFLSKYKDELISALPVRLLEIQKEYDKKLFSNHEKKVISSFFKETGYKNFQKNNGKTFLNLLKTDTCIYCNRNYTLDFDKTTHARAELDHWFPKDKFPILALSFYNLIPSCHLCNHMKGSPDYDWYTALDKMNHPYQLADESFRFSYLLNSLNSFQIITKTKLKSKTEETLVFNMTNEIYNVHGDKELNDLLNLRYKYSKNYLDILLNKTFNDLPISKEETYRMIFGIEIKEEDHHKRPFSKFKHDIIQELIGKI